VNGERDGPPGKGKARNASTSARANPKIATSKTPIPAGQSNSAANDALVARGKALADSGKHAPPPQQWTADELRCWFGQTQPCDVVNLEDYRRRRLVCRPPDTWW
jgi:hypothetical protein